MRDASKALLAVKKAIEDDEPPAQDIKKAGVNKALTDTLDALLWSLTGKVVGTGSAQSSS